MNGRVSMFYRQFAALLKSGLTLTRALSVLERQGSKQQKKMIHKIKQCLHQGATFSQSIQGFPIFFSTLDIRLIQIGELNGQLDEMVKNISEIKNTWIQLKLQILSRSVYPILLLHVAMLIKFIVRWFTSQSGAVTEMLHAISLFYGSIIFVILVRKVAVHFLWLRWLLDAIVFHVPLIRDLIKGLGHIRFASTLSILLKSGISTVQSLQLAVTSTGNLVLEQNIKSIPDDVSKNITLNCAMERTGMFPSHIIALVRTGEESGKTVAILDKISNLTHHNVQQALARLSNIISGLVYLTILLWIASLITF